MTIEMIRDHAMAAPGVVHVQAVRADIERFLEGKSDGCFRGSLKDLGVATGCTIKTLRSALALLDPIDHAISIDLRVAPMTVPFTLSWAPVTSLVNRLIDWDLLLLQVCLDELEYWLEESRPVTIRALEWLSRIPGASVELDTAEETVRIEIDIDACPLVTGMPAP
jgi:hypothetical protein